MKKSQPNVSKLQIFKLSLVIFLILAALLTALTGPLIYSFEKNRKEVIVARESGYLKAAKQFFQTKLFEAYADIGLLANLPALSTYIEIPNPQNKKKLEQYFIGFVEEYKHYDQVRFIDNRGQERIRVNYLNNKAVIMADEALQNKAGRYYFQAIQNLRKGERYISPMDLNKEHGRVETPYKPMIRFAMPVFDRNGVRKGAIMTNYHSGKLLHTFKALMKKSDLTRSMLLNNEGYWLTGTQPEKSWGFMFDRNEDNFALQKPDVWRLISTQSDGQIETGEGLYLFLTFQPLGIDQEYPDKGVNNNTRQDSDNYSWKIVHLIPKDSLYQTSLLNSTWGLTWTLSSYFGLALLSWMIASFRIHSLRHTQQLLTKDKHLSDINRRNDLATDSAGIGIWELDFPTGKLVWDDWMLRLYGVAPETFHNSLQEWENAVHPDDKKAVLDAVEESIHEQKSFHYQFRIRHPSGQIHWIKADAIIEYDENGAASRMIGANRDITQQLNNEIRIKNTLKELNEAQGMAHIGSWSLELQTGHLEWSDEYYNVLEIQKETFKPSYDFFLNMIHPDDRDDVNSAYRQSVTDHKPYSIEHRLLFSDGRIKYVHQRGQTIYSDGIPLRSQGTLQDITERKSAEQKTAQLLKIIEESPDFIGTSDLEGNLLYHNSAAKRMVGLEANADLSHLNIKDMHPDWAGKKVFEEAFPIIATQGCWHSENVLLHHDGHEIPVLQTIMLHRDEKGKPEHLSTIIRDISESKRTEEELRRAKQIAEKASQAKSIFLANMSHEIRTPIHTTMGVLTLLSDTALNQEQKNYLQQAQNSTNILLNLLNDILDFSKIESGKVELEQRPIPFPKLLSQVYSTMRTQAVYKGIDLKFNPGDNLPEWVIGDRTRLMQVLINLISNAIKFTPEGQVLFNVTAIPIENNWRITFEISDTGIGIPTGKIENIFEPFIQAENDTARKYGGTGLGLAISRRVINLMGGQLLVESREGEGSRFYFTVSMPEADSEETHGKQANNDLIGDLSRHNALHGKRILLAEDNPALQEMTRLYLEKQGAVIKIAGNGREAVDLINHDAPFDLVLMDIQMPVMDGHEAARIIRKEHGAEQLPIIAMTASALKQDRDKAFSAGMNDYIIKPFDLAGLTQLLSDYLPPGSDDAPDNSRVSNPDKTSPEAVELDNPKGFDLTNALSRMNDMPMIYTTVAKQFINEYPALRQQFHRLLADQDFPQAARIAHRLKGSTSQLGAVSLTNFLKEAESAINSEPGANAVNLLKTQFDRQFEDAISALKRILTTLGDNA